MKYFDHFARNKSTNIGRFLHDRKVKNNYKYITKFTANKDAEILEIGPNKGDLAKIFLKNKYLNYDIVEPNTMMRKNLIKKGVRNAKDYMIPLLEEKKNSYDVIVLCDVFEHLNDTKEAISFVSEANRVLRKKGILFIYSPDLRDWGLDFWNCDFSHSNPTTLRRTIQLFFNNNLKVLDYKYTYSCFEGIFGYFISRIVKTLTFFVSGDSIDLKSYKLRLTFLRRFGIIGQKK